MRKDQKLFRLNCFDARFGDVFRCGDFLQWQLFFQAFDKAIIGIIAKAPFEPARLDGTGFCIGIFIIGALLLLLRQQEL